jgi:hypothetical protein
MAEGVSPQRVFKAEGSRFVSERKGLDLILEFLFIVLWRIG